METITVRFAETARSLGRAARLRGLEVPTFRSPPSLCGVQRSIRRRSGSATIAVVMRGRPWGAVVADMVEGIVVVTASSARNLASHPWTWASRCLWTKRSSPAGRPSRCGSTAVSIADRRWWRRSSANWGRWSADAPNWSSTACWAGLRSASVDGALEGSTSGVWPRMETADRRCHTATRYSKPWRRSPFASRRPPDH